MRWAPTKENERNGRFHLWTEIVDHDGQPVRRRTASPLEPDAFIVAAFGFDRDAALRKIEQGKPAIERLATTQL